MAFYLFNKYLHNSLNVEIIMYFNRLLTTTFYPPKYWRLEKPLKFTPELTQEELDILATSECLTNVDRNGTVNVPVNFLSDLASVPRLCWWILAPFDIARPAVIHDYLYRQLKTCNKYDKKVRKVADKIFKQGMEVLWPKPSKITIMTVYLLVRMFGWIAVKYGSIPELPDVSEHNDK